MAQSVVGAVAVEDNDRKCYSKGSADISVHADHFAFPFVIWVVGSDKGFQVLRMFLNGVTHHARRN